jgi:hypothetical protein
MSLKHALKSKIAPHCTKTTKNDLKNDVKKQLMQ